MGSCLQMELECAGAGVANSYLLKQLNHRGADCSSVLTCTSYFLCFRKSRVFPDFAGRALVFLLVPITSGRALGAAEQSLTVMFVPSVEVLEGIDENLPEPLPGWAAPAPCLFSHEKYFTDQTWLPYIGLFPVAPCFSYTGKPRIGLSVSWSVLSRGEQSPPSICCQHFA